MKIIIDARMYGLEHTGIGRYIINLINQIDKISFQSEDKNEYIILLRKKYFDSLVFKNKNIKKVLADYSHYSFKEQFLLPFQLFLLKPNVVHFPHFNVPFLWFGKYVVTIHDLIKHQSRGIKTTTHNPFIYWLKHIFYLFIVYSAVKRAKKVITPSKWWKNELIKIYNLTQDKVVVTYEGVDDKFKFKKESSSNVLDKFKIKKPFVIYTGSLYPHKNADRLLEAIIKINREKKIKLNLVLVCARNFFLKRFEKKVKDKKAESLVKLIGFVDDKDLVALYKEAEAFVFPSLLEGFGLTGLEAMSLGLPTICSSASCLPEVYGQAVAYFDPLDINDMVEKIIQVVSDDDFKKCLTKAGFEKVKEYSWQKMAKETLMIYKSVS